MSLFPTARRYRRRVLLAGAVAAGSIALITPGVARADEPSYGELKRLVGTLQSRIEKLEGRADAAAAAQDAAAVDEAVDAVLADADRRSKLLAVGGFTAGYDKGFVLRSEDGSFVLKPGVQFQTRYVANFNDEEASEDENGFEVRRLRFRFDGNAFTPDLTYSFQWDTNRAGGAVSLLDAWVQYAFAKNFALKLGQFKESVFHERDVSGFAQLAVDRTLVDSVLGGNLTDRVQGVSLIYGGNKDVPLRVELAYTDGANSRNTNFQDAGTEFGVAGRAEYKAFGDWASYKDFTAKGTKENLLVLGVGADFTQRDTFDSVLAVADAQFETNTGLGVFGAVHLAYADPRDGDGDGTDDGDTRTDYGALIQAGYLINPRWEIFGRYDVVALDDDALADDAGDLFNEFTIGFNHYFGEAGNALHKAKLTLDAVYLPDGSPSNQTGIGAPAGDESQFLIRAQFQLIL